MSDTKKIGIDFDGTCVFHKYPDMGPPVPDAIRVMKRLVEAGHKLILFTMRDEEGLQEAVDWFEWAGIPLYGVNVDPDQHTWTSSPKAYASVYIDDRALGCPLYKSPICDRPAVDWNKIEDILIEMEFLNGTELEHAAE